MIRSFVDKRTAAIWADRMPKGFASDLGTVARRKLRALAAARLDDLRLPPGNRLEALVGNRTGQHSIRVNDQWRLCFVWRDGDAWDVKIVDYTLTLREPENSSCESQPRRFCLAV